jgi:hypothetical protein
VLLVIVVSISLAKDVLSRDWHDEGPVEGAARAGPRERIVAACPTFRRLRDHEECLTAGISMDVEELGFCAFGVGHSDANAARTNITPVLSYTRALRIIFAHYVIVLPW